MEQLDKNWVTTAEAAEVAKVDPRAVRYWKQAGIIRFKTISRADECRRPRLLVWLPDIEEQAGMVRERGRIPEGFWPERPKVAKDNEVEEQWIDYQEDDVDAPACECCKNTETTCVSTEPAPTVCDPVEDARAAYNKQVESVVILAHTVKRCAELEEENARLTKKLEEANELLAMIQSFIANR